MNRTAAVLLWAAIFLGLVQPGFADEVVDVPTRPGVTQRLLLLSPPNPSATVILFAGADGGLQISSSGTFAGGSGNFLVRSRSLFVENGLMVAIVDAPSDRTTLSGFRQTPEHAVDIKAVIAWLKQRANLPVWLIGTSRGTQSAAYIATQLLDKSGPDGIVLTSTILADPKGRPVPDLDLGRLKIPVLVVHHERDGCKLCDPVLMPRLMNKLSGVARKELITFKGGEDTGEPCEAFAHHGFNGIEKEVVRRIAEWITATTPIKIKT
jgi:pimeloyl-ACP methyl ester carboxylesterase